MSVGLFAAPLLNAEVIFLLLSGQFVYRSKRRTLSLYLQHVDNRTTATFLQNCIIHSSKSVIKYDGKQVFFTV